VTTSDFHKGKPYPDPKFAALWDVIPWSLVKKSAGISEDPAASNITTTNIHCPSALMMDAAGFSAMSLTTHQTAYKASQPRTHCCSNLKHPDPPGHTKPRSRNEVSTLPQQYKESCWNPEISLLCQGVLVCPCCA